MSNRLTRKNNFSITKVSKLKTSFSQLSVCQAIASVNEHVGGPAYSVTNLAKYLSKQHICSHLFTLDYRWHGKLIIPENVISHSQKATQLARYIRGFQPSAGYYLSQLASTELDLIHNHGLWMFPNLYARQAAIRNKIPLVISPRGMLEPWSLKNSWYKKWLAWFLYEKQNLKNATIFHATSTSELESIRQLGYKQPIALIPNGIDIPSLDEAPTKQLLIQSFPELIDKKWLLFLSRIHPKKGLDNLLYTWQKLTKKFSDWHLIVAGPDAIGYQEKLKSLTLKLQLEKQVTFTGMLSGNKKASALKNADLFVLPTHSENFGIAIAESLSYAVPVVTTKCAPWQSLIEHDCGWWIDNNQQALETALHEGMQLSDCQRRQMGLRGRTMVEKKYSWDVIAQDMSEVYHWVLNRGNPPKCVDLHTSY